MVAVCVQGVTVGVKSLDEPSMWFKQHLETYKMLKQYQRSMLW